MLASALLACESGDLSGWITCKQQLRLVSVCRGPRGQLPDDHDRYSQAGRVGQELGHAEALGGCSAGALPSQLMSPPSCCKNTMCMLVRML